MPIGLYQFTIDEAPAASYGRIPDAFVREINGQTNLREWLALRYPGGCAFFYRSSADPALPETTALFRRHQVLPASDCPVKPYRHRAAVERFLEMAAGLVKVPGNRRLVEIMHALFAHPLEQSRIGPYFHRLFQQGILLHEKVRQETRFFQFAVEPAAVVRELAGKVLDFQKRPVVCIIGKAAGIPNVLLELREAGCRRFIFLDNAPAIDEDLVNRLNGVADTAAGLGALPGEADIILIGKSATHRPDAAHIHQRLRSRTSSLLIFNFTGEALNSGRLRRQNNLYLYDRSDVENVVRYNEAERGEERREVYRWLAEEVASFYDWHSREDRFQFAGIIGADPVMQQIFELISRIARSDITVLIDGESGTGKELVARAIHRLSQRSERPFQVINCGAIPENLLESELFGHVRGAFTGAVVSKKGLFETADSGTVFLDEIGELPSQLQVKLLRFLQAGELRPVGGNDTVHTDVRVLAATNKNLADMVGKGAFRSDLYYRLNVIQLTLPPLRDRREDLPLLARAFVRKFSQRMNKDVTGLTREALNAIRTYQWPGNVRELENAVERAVALAVGKQIARYDLPPAVQNAPDNTGTVPENILSLKDVERQHILAILEICDWNYEQAARHLGIGRTTLWRKLREYDVVEPGG